MKITEASAKLIVPLVFLVLGIAGFLLSKKFGVAPVDSALAACETSPFVRPSILSGVNADEFLLSLNRQNNAAEMKCRSLVFQFYRHKKEI